MGKISVDLSDEPSETSAGLPQAATERAKLKALSAGLPSASKARSDSMKHARRVTWSFTNIPEPIKARTMAQADAMQMGLKEFFYHCLRLGGVEIPETEDIDGRRR